MRVTLIDYTADAAKLLAFTKNTRFGLNQTQAAFYNAMTKSELDEELKYMANTIPSSWEFASYTFLIENVSRAFTHQFVRNRHGSYAQESLRVADKAEYKFVMPQSIAEHAGAHDVVDELNAKIRETYMILQELGIPTEDCRSILPTNIATNIIARFNLRTLAELLKSRLGGRTQSEYRRVAHSMAEAVLQVHPWAAHFFFGEEGRDYYKEIEDFAEREYGGDLIKKGELLKIVDKMRKG